MELRYQKDTGTQNNVTEHKTPNYSRAESTGNNHNAFHTEAEKQDIYSKRLKRLRLSHLLCQKEMAIKFNISQQSYAKLEAGKTLFTQNKIENICRIFNIQFNEFIMFNCNESLVIKSIEPSILQTLKMHYEKLLLQQEMRINELEIKLRGK